jgi:hypothetical protein
MFTKHSFHLSELRIISELEILNDRCLLHFVVSLRGRSAGHSLFQHETTLIVILVIMSVVTTCKVKLISS